MASGGREELIPPAKLAARTDLALPPVIGLVMQAGNLPIIEKPKHEV